MAYIISTILLLFSALFSGVTIGFFSLNNHDLKRKAELGNKSAKKIYSLRKNSNRLLCTLLIGNVAVNSALSIFLGSIASGFTAGIISTSLIVLFGEIAPQAVFSKHALRLGSKFVWLIKIISFVLFPVCWPLSWLLNSLLGKEMPTIYSKKELIKIIEMHEDLKESEIDADEERIMKGVLSYSDKNVINVMTLKKDVFFLQGSKKINGEIIQQIINAGHSRIPVYGNSKNTILGILYMKDLVCKNLNTKTIKDLCRKKVICVNQDESLDDVLNLFKKTRNHLFIVSNKRAKVTGIVTIEDIIEEIIGAEILDEFDSHEK